MSTIEIISQLGEAATSKFNFLIGKGTSEEDAKVKVVMYAYKELLKKAIKFNKSNDLDNTENDNLLKTTKW